MLAKGAALRVTAAGALEIERADRPVEHITLAQPSRRPPPIAGAASHSGAAALVACAGDDQLVWVSADAGPTRRLPLGERIPNAAQLAIFAVEGGFGVLTEHGLASIDERGHERWRVDRVTFDWRFVDERDGALWLADADGNLLGFDAAAGWERT